MATTSPHASDVARSKVDDVVARIERLPISAWHVKARVIIGVATFFDAFDALAIAFVLPVLVPLWKLTSPQVGVMISVGYLGQLFGALGCSAGWRSASAASRRMVWSVLLFALMSFACAFAWDYQSLLVFRTIQGVGLGGEVPVAAVYISEIARAKGRGRFVLLYELIFPIGLVAAGLLGTLGRAASRLALHVPDRRDPGRSSRCSCSACCRNRRAGSPCAAATTKRKPSLVLYRAETEKATGKPLPAAQSGRRDARASRPRGPTCSGRNICAARWSCG